MEHNMDIPIWTYVASMTGYTVFLVLMVAFMCKHLKLTMIWWFLVLLTIPFWAENLHGWFRWSKTLSMLVPVALVIGGTHLSWYYKENKSRIAIFFRGNWPLYIFWFFLSLNILEATFKDLTTGNYFNFAAGLLLAMTIPFPRYKKSKRFFWAVGIKEKTPCFLFFSTAMWNFLYTTWNMAFVYGEHPSYFASSCCILIAAELYPLIKRRPELYIIARVYTLCFHLFLRANGDIFTPVMDSSSWANETVLQNWGIFNLCLHLPFAIWFFWKMRKNGEPPTGKNLPPLISDYQEVKDADKLALANMKI
jgi:hypothetical protein